MGYDQYHTLNYWVGIQEPKIGIVVIYNNYTTKVEYTKEVIGETDLDKIMKQFLDNKGLYMNRNDFLTNCVH